MKYRLVNPELNSPYLENLLKERGVEDVKEYIKPTRNYLNDPAKLDNIEKGAELYLDVVKRNGNILIVVDSDCDGFTSATIIYQYTKKIAPEIRISYVLHEGKQHGLNDCMDYINSHAFNLVLIPDAGSNDYEAHAALNKKNIDTIILSKTGVDLYNSKVLRSTQGMIFNINIVVSDITETDNTNLDYLSKMGLITNHAYSVIDTAVLRDSHNGNEIRLIKIRNPWGTNEWLGDWSDGSRKWSEEFKQIVGLEEKEDGVFWMSYEKHKLCIIFVIIFFYH